MQGSGPTRCPSPESAFLARGSESSRRRAPPGPSRRFSCRSRSCSRSAPTSAATGRRPGAGRRSCFSRAAILVARRRPDRGLDSCCPPLCSPWSSGGSSPLPGARRDAAAAREPAHGRLRGRRVRRRCCSCVRLLPSPARRHVGGDRARLLLRIADPALSGATRGRRHDSPAIGSKRHSDTGTRSGSSPALGALLARGSRRAGAARSCGRSPRARAVLVLVPTLYFTFSRGAWVALAVGLVTMLVLDAHRLRLVTSLLVVAPWPALAVWHASRSHPLTRVGGRPATAEHAGHRYVVVPGTALPSAQRRRCCCWPGRPARADAEARSRRLWRGRVARRRGRGRDRRRPLWLAADDRPQGLPQLRRSGRPAHERQPQHPPLQPRRGTGESLSGRSRGASTGRTRGSDRARAATSGTGTSYRPQASKVRNVHNLYLETLAELGPVGLALLLVALGGAAPRGRPGTPARCSFRLRRRRTSRFSRTQRSTGTGRCRR